MTKKGKHKKSGSHRSFEKSEKFIRAFICINLPVSVRAWLAGIQKSLKKSGIRASWPKPDSLHITLKFLGDTSLDSVGLIQKAMDQAASHFGPFKVSGAGLGCFPSVKRPRVLWVGIRGQTDCLEQLAKSVESCLYDLASIKMEKRRFSPHLTLARIKPPMVSPKKVISLMQDFELSESEVFTISQIKLMKSTLLSSGAVHEEIYTSSLKSDLVFIPSELKKDKS